MQSSLAPRSNQKLAYKFFGPFQIIGKIGAVAYRLALPASSLIHLVFHVSQLKRAIPRNTEVVDLSAALDSHQFPERVLQRRVVSRGDVLTPQILVKWSNMSSSLATWEDTEALQQCFPAAPVWGQSGSYPGGVSNTPSMPPDELIKLPDVDMPKAGRRSGREKKPNRMVTGLEWLRPMM